MLAAFLKDSDGKIDIAGLGNCSRFLEGGVGCDLNSLARSVIIRG
jgi:hypothetical protein